ncbi:MAG TPA: HD domain-containing phosphohydrolase [Mariprofundaceae bacterium]|nr:HD domain-containing phosphohydrolase [Mariprofundaceae bacterium]
MTLKFRLIALLVLLALLPLLVLGLTGIKVQRDSLKEEELIHQRILSNLTLHYIQSMMNERKADIKVMQDSFNIWQNLPVLQEHINTPDSPAFRQAAAALSVQLDRIRDVYQYDNVMLLDRHGRLAFATDISLAGQALGQPLPVPHDKVFAAASKGIYISPVFASTAEENHPHFWIAAPVNNANDSLIGAILLQVDMQQIYENLQNLPQLGKTGEVLLAVTLNGDIQFISPVRSNSGFLKLPQEGPLTCPMKQALLGEAGEGIALDYRGHEVLAAWTPVPELGWGMVVKIDTGEAFSTINRFQVWGLVFILAIALLSIGLAMVVSRSITGQLLRVQAASEQIGAGNFEFRVGNKSEDEIGQLSRALDDMADRLSRSQKQMGLTEHMAKLGSWQLDLTSNQMVWSDEVYLIFEIDPERFEATYEAFLEAVHPEDRQAVDEAHKTSLQSRKPCQIEHRLRMPDGRIKYVREMCEATWDEHGRPLLSQGTVQDITSIRELESEKLQSREMLQRINRDLKKQVKLNAEVTKQLKEKVVRDEETRQAMLLMLEDINTTNLEIEHAKREWESTFDAVTQPIFLHDADGIIVRANKAYAELSGMHIVKVVGRPYWKIFPKLPSQPEYCLKGCVTGKMTNCEIRLDEGEAIYSVNMYPVPDEHGNIQFSIHLMEDITAARAASLALEKSSSQLQRALEGTIASVARMVEARDPYTAGHQKRVSAFATAIGEEMGLSPDRVRGIELGSSIHDIGKIQLPAEILSKPGRLTEIEYQLVKAHAQEGYNILKDIEFPWPIAEIAHQHHERLDGSGYPQGLKGDEILLEARIVAVADVVEAMSSHRPYRAGLGISIALDEVRKGRGIGFDADVVDACLKLIESKKFTFDE